MVITLTPIARTQWKRVGVVAVWLAASLAASAALAWVTKHKDLFGTTAPIFNFIGVIVQQILSQEESAAIDKLPAANQDEVTAGVDAAAAKLDELARPPVPTATPLGIAGSVPPTPPALQ